MTTPWRHGDALFANPKRKPATPSDWRPPTALPFVRVGRGELTCVSCGETFGASRPVTGEATFCWRCGGKDGVPTVSYLREGEYEEAR